MHNDSIAILLRSFFYILVVGGASLLLFLDAQLPVSKFSEVSLTETTQKLLFVSLACGYLLHARFGASADQLALMFAGFFTMLFIREMDQTLDTMLFDGGWQLLVGTILMAMLYQASRNWSRLWAQFLAYLQTPSFGLFLAGFLTTVVFSRLIGNNGFWEVMMGEEYIRNVKNAVEEGTELFGDILMFLAGIEFYFRYRDQAHALAARPQASPSRQATDGDSRGLAGGSGRRQSR